MAAEITCETCSATFKVDEYRRNSARFCSLSCRSKGLALHAFANLDHSYKIGNTWAKGRKPANAFKKGHKPWNKEKRGIHLSAATEFKPGPRPDKRAAIGTESFRVVHGGSTRCFVKVAHPNVWRLRAHAVWEQNCGPIKARMLIHHHDRDPLNDDIGNLAMMTRAEHINEHRGDFLSGR